jgi:hypothetical protein
VAIEERAVEPAVEQCSAAGGTEVLTIARASTEILVKRGSRDSIPISLRSVATWLLVAASLIGRQIPAQTAQIPAGPAGGVIASKLPDAEGVHLGMSVAQATAVMKALFPGSGLQLLYSHFQNGPAWVSSMKGQSQDQTDFLSVFFSMPPNPQQVTFLQRTVIMPSGKQPTVANTMAGLRQKYGTELKNTKPGTGIVGWAYDEQGQPASPQGPENWNPADCANQMMGVAGGLPDPTSSLEVNASVDPIPLAQQLPGFIGNLCNRNVFVTAQMLAGSIQGTSVVNQMYIYLGEKPLALRDTVAADQFLEGQTAAKQRQQQKNAEQNKAPTL